LRAVRIGAGNAASVIRIGRCRAPALTQPHCRRAEVQQSAVEQQHGPDQQPANDEFPEERADLGAPILDDKVDRRTDKGAVKALADTAKDQRNRDDAGGQQAEHREADKLGRLRRQRAGRSRHRRRDRVDRDEPPPYRRADRAHAPRVLANAVERTAEWRGDDAARQQKPQKQHDCRVDVRGLAEQVKVKAVKNRVEPDALQPVVAAGQIVGAIGVFRQRRDDGQRQHQQRDTGRMQDHRAGHQAKQRRRADRREMPQQRVGRHVDREETGGVGADAEKSGLPQRQNPGIAERQVERHRKQDPDHDLGPEAQVIGRPIVIRDHEYPGQRVPGCGQGAPCEPAHAAAFGGNRPRGRHSSRTNTAA
jgi:hypothetical protein